MVVIPYVENVSEAVARIRRKHNVPVAIKPYKTLKTVLVHPKNKQEKEDLTECVYKVPCANCDKTYIGETGRKFEVRLQEHRTEVESKTGRTFTRSLRPSSLTEHNKSAFTDHATQENHVINWSQATVIDREPERFTRWIKEAIHVRKEGQQAMNRDEGSYQLSHAYDRLLDTASSRCVKQTRIAKHPVFSTDALLEAEGKSKVFVSNKINSVSPKRKAVYVTTTESSSDGDGASSQATVAAQVVSAPRRIVPACPMCTGSHDLDDCQQYLQQTLDDRHKFLISRKLCFSCYGQSSRNHTA